MRVLSLICVCTRLACAVDIRAKHGKRRKLLARRQGLGLVSRSVRLASALVCRTEAVQVFYCCGARRIARWASLCAVSGATVPGYTLDRESYTRQRDDRGAVPNPGRWDTAPYGPAVVPRSRWRAATCMYSPL